MWTLYTFLWQWAHVQSCLHPYPPTQSHAIVLLCLSDGSEGAGGIPHIPLSTWQKASRSGRDAGREGGSGTGAYSHPNPMKTHFKNPTSLNWNLNDAL